MISRLPRRDVGGARDDTSIVFSLCVFIFACAWFAVFIPWSGFSDPDAFYHAHASALLLKSGPITTFPWLDLTLLGSSYADLHFLFHLLTAPFVRFFGPFQGLRIATIAFAAMFMAVFDACLRWLKLRYASAWIILLATSHALIFRLLLGKATPLALLLFVFGLAAAWKRRPFPLFAITAAYALTHGGWMYLAGSVLLLAVGDLLYNRLVVRTPSSQEGEFRELMSWIFLVCSSFAGGFVGLILHPNFSETLWFAWAQVVTIGLGTPFRHVILGAEWQPADPASLLATLAPWSIVLLLAFAGLFFTWTERPRPTITPDDPRPRLVGAFGCVVAVLLALTLKSRRNIEYLIPALALWSASIWNLVDVRALADALSLRGAKRRSNLVILFCCLALILGRQIHVAWTSLHPPVYADHTYRSAMSEISHRAHPGDRIFHASWDEFPILFAADDRLRYVSGLDPTFLYIASSTVSDRVRDVTCPVCRKAYGDKRPWSISTSTRDEAWTLIHDELHSSFVFVSKREQHEFLDLIRSDPRYAAIANTTDSAAFFVQ